MAGIEKLIEFMGLMNRYREVERVIRIKNSNRLENDVEHSYSLTMLAWYLMEVENLDLDKEKVLKYALIHDLVEVYAGDVEAIGRSKDDQVAKDEAEKAATERIRAELPLFGELHEMMAIYEKREDPESKFVYALDKLHPIINVYADGGRTWKEMGYGLDMIKKNKAPKVAVDKTVERYYNEIIALVEKDEDELFGN